MEPEFESDFFKQPDLKLPVRQTFLWETDEVIQIIDKSSLLKIFTGKAPIGKLPYELLSEPERIDIIAELGKLAMKKYDNTAEEQQVSVWGNPFVDRKTLHDYLTSPIDPAFVKIASPVMDKILALLRSWGFNPLPLIDPDTMLPYSSKVFRYISCKTKGDLLCTVLHCDDIIRDGIMKPDFRYPLGLAGREYYQLSLNILLEDGGYAPDKLIIYEKQYSAEMEPNFLPNRWQLPLEEVNDCRHASLRPSVGDCYFFNSLNFHDVTDGDPLSKRLTFSVFFIYVLETAKMYYYN